MGTPDASVPELAVNYLSSALSTQLSLLADLCSYGRGRLDSFRLAFKGPRAAAWGDLPGSQIAAERLLSMTKTLPAILRGWEAPSERRPWHLIW